MVAPSLSKLPLGTNDYCDGEVYDLYDRDRQELCSAIMTELWLNVSPNFQQYWLSVIRSDLVRFVGTVVSRSRCQVEITVRFRSPHALHGHMSSFCITLERFNRFRALCECHAV